MAVPHGRSTWSLAGTFMTDGAVTLVVVGAVPIIAMMQDGAGIFASRRFAVPVWTALVCLAIVAVLEDLGLLALWRPSSGSVLLFALPLIQAILFLASQQLFRLIYGRGTVCFSEAKNQRGTDGRVRWNDLTYWVLVGYVGAALSFLVAFKTGLRLGS